jgi:N-acetyl-alpha-D-glucosaminyl L-malate synthase BshA
MKIAIVCHPTHGGSGVIASEVGMRLAQRGHEIHFVSHERPFRLDPLTLGVHYHRVHVSSYPLFRYPPYALALANQLSRVIQDHEIDVIHAHYAIPHSLAAILARNMNADQGVKVVTTLHGTDITLVGADPSYTDITRWSMEQSDHVTGVSDWLVEETRQELGAHLQVETIPNAVDTDSFSPDRARAELRSRFAPQGELLLAHVSNFRPVKRTGDVLRIFAKAAKDLPASLLMIGDGPDRAAAETLARELGIWERVHWLGIIDDTAPLLASSDLFLLPSENESFGLAALEAMACGLPVIATASGGMPEVIVDGETGYLAPVGDIDALAEGTRRLLEDVPRRSLFAATGRQRVEERFRWDPVISQYEKLYGQLFSGGS